MMMMMTMVMVMTNDEEDNDFGDYVNNDDDVSNGDGNL